MTLTFEAKAGSKLTHDERKQLRKLERHIYPPHLVIDLFGLETAPLVIMAKDVIRIVGYLIVEPDLEHPGELAIGDLAVLPTYRLRAVKPLVQAVCQWSKTNQVSSFYAYLRENTSYRLFYKHGKQLGLVIGEILRLDYRDDERFYSARLDVLP